MAGRMQTKERLGRAHTRVSETRKYDQKQSGSKRRWPPHTHTYFRSKQGRNIRGSSQYKNKENCNKKEVPPFYWQFVICGRRKKSFPNMDGTIKKA